MMQLEIYLNSLPSNTEYIDISGQNLTEFPTELLSRFKNLKRLNCSNNKLTSLPPFNNSLRSLYCSNNLLTSLPPLPTNLRSLYCNFNRLTSLPSLNVNNSLFEIYCHNNRLTFLPSLPPSLQILDCGSNQLTMLPPLNNSLTYLYCHNNQLTSLPSLHHVSLYTLDCRNNLLTSLTYRPSFKVVYCNENNGLISLTGFENYFGFLEWSETPIYDLLDGDQENIAKWTRFREYYFPSKLKKKIISWMWKAREERIKEQFHYKHLLRFMEESDDLEDLDPFLENFCKCK